jgi:hypothetical protein
MAVVITYNPDIFSIYQTFYNARKIDLIESLAWLSADEKSMGTSKEQGTLITYLAQFYFTVIQLLEQTNNPDWNYLDWLTQEEYDKIIYKLSLVGATPDIINIPGMVPGIVPITTSGEYIPSVSTTITIPANVTTRYNLNSTTKPISIIMYDNTGMVISSHIGQIVTLVDNLYVLDIINDSNDELTDVELKIQY